MNAEQFNAILSTVSRIDPYDPKNETTMLAIGFQKRRKKPIVIFSKIVDKAQTAIEDERGKLECEVGDHIIIKIIDAERGKLDQWSCQPDIFERTYEIQTPYQAKNRAEFSLLTSGYLPYIKTSWQWMMQITGGFDRLIVPTVENGTINLYSRDWLVVGVKREFYPISDGMIHEYDLI